MPGLTVKLNDFEPLYIGDDITVKLFHRNGCAYANVEAPRSTVILRSKAKRKIKANVIDASDVGISGKGMPNHE